MLKNLRQTVSMYNISRFFGIAFTQSMTSKNITSGFRISEIFPCNQTTCIVDDFLVSYITDRLSSHSTTLFISLYTLDSSSSNVLNLIKNRESLLNLFLSSFDILPLAKATKLQKKKINRMSRTTKLRNNESTEYERNKRMS